MARLAGRDAARAAAGVAERVAGQTGGIPLVLELAAAVEGGGWSRLARLRDRGLVHGEGDRVALHGLVARYGTERAREAGWAEEALDAALDAVRGRWPLAPGPWQTAIRGLCGTRATSSWRSAPGTARSRWPTPRRSATLAEARGEPALACDLLGHAASHPALEHERVASAQALASRPGVLWPQRAPAKGRDDAAPTGDGLRPSVPAFHVGFTLMPRPVA